MGGIENLQDRRRFLSHAGLTPEGEDPVKKEEETLPEQM